VDASERPAGDAAAHLHGTNGGHIWRTSLNEDHWKPALAKVGIIPKAKSREHAAAREHGMNALRHLYASVLLDAGESIKALAEYPGHSDPGLTLEVYAHLMPSSRDRARKALGRALRPQDPGARGPREGPGRENAPEPHNLRSSGA
jgi:hypothetical protein